MKVKIYSILLLFSFLVIISHEMIPHHHHEEIEEYSLAFPSIVEKHTHHDKDHFHLSEHDMQLNDEADINDRHKHSFPLHHHLLASYDYDFVRLNTKNTNLFQASLIQLFLTEKISFGFFKNFDSQCLKPPDHPPRIKSLFEPGTINLRAPPYLS